jgi:hypothetical protein
MGSLSIGSPTEAGTIAFVIKGSFKKIRACYDQGLKRDPNLGGKVVVRFEIEPSGAVGKSEATSETVKDPAMLKCVRDLFAGLKFPRPPGGGRLSLTYPITFTLR